MYEYMETRDIGFVENLFSDAVLQRNKFNLVVVYSETGDIVYGKYYDYESDTEQIVPAAFRQDFTYNALKNYDPDTSSVTGIINNQGQPIIIASRPIIDTSETAPSKGTLVLGLDFSLDEIEPIQDHSGLPLEYHDPDSDAIPSQVRAELSIDNPFTYIINPDSVTGFYLVEDVFGDSGLIVSVSQPREDIWLVRA